MHGLQAAGSAVDLEADAQAAPVTSVDDDRGRKVFHQAEIAAAHVAPVGLQQERLLVAPGGEPGAVIEDPAVAAISRIPDGIGTLRLGICLLYTSPSPRD